MKHALAITLLLASAGFAADTTTAPSTAPATQPKVEPLGKIGAAGVREMTLPELGYFPYDEEKGGNIPAEVLALNGKKVRVRGYIMTLSQIDNMTDFALIPVPLACCYGQPPVVQQVVTVNFPKGKEVEFVYQEIWVEGILRVKEERHDGFTTQLFSLEGISVKVIE